MKTVIVFDSLGETRKRSLTEFMGRSKRIKGRPNEHDLTDVENRVRGILASLTAWHRQE